MPWLHVSLSVFVVDALPSLSSPLYAPLVPRNLRLLTATARIHPLGPPCLSISEGPCTEPVVPTWRLHLMISEALASRCTVFDVLLFLPAVVVSVCRADRHLCGGRSLQLAGNFAGVSLFPLCASIGCRA